MQSNVSSKEKLLYDNYTSCVVALVYAVLFANMQTDKTFDAIQCDNKPLA